jgi:proteasome lid subunit RPN8/RPN11
MPSKTRCGKAKSLKFINNGYGTDILGAERFAFRRICNEQGFCVAAPTPQVGNYWRDSYESVLGDWHTHPNGENVLSSKDVLTLNLIADTESARIAERLMIIATGGPQRWNLHGWRAVRRSWRRFGKRIGQIPIQTY